MICIDCGEHEAPIGRKVCHKCRTRRYKRLHPMEYWFNTFRCNAKRRGKDFTLTIIDFREFCNETGYIEKKGTTPDSLSIDRKDPRYGYHKWNIRAITLSYNSQLGNDYKKQKEEEIECPF